MKHIARDDDGRRGNKQPEQAMKPLMQINPLDETGDQIRLLRAAGMNVAAIARQLGIDVYRVHRYIRRYDAWMVTATSGSCQAIAMEEVRFHLEAHKTYAPRALSGDLAAHAAVLNGFRLMNDLLGLSSNSKARAADITNAVSSQMIASLFEAMDSLPDAIQPEVRKLLLSTWQGIVSEKLAGSAIETGISRIVDSGAIPELERIQREQTEMERDLEALLAGSDQIDPDAQNEG